MNKEDFSRLNSLNIRTMLPQMNLEMVKLFSSELAHKQRTTTISPSVLDLLTDSQMHLLH